MSKMMRFFTVILWIQLFVFMTSFAYGQKVKPNTVPNEVKETLQEEQGEVKVNQWILDGDMYIANFKVDGTTAMAYIQSDGTYIRTSTVIPKSTLPTLILEYINKEYPEFVIAVSEIREQPEVRLFYHVEIRPEVLGAKHSILTFDNAGRLLTRTDPEGFTAPELTPQQLVQEKADRKITESTAPKGKNKTAPKTTTPAPKTEKQPAQTVKPEPKAKTETKQKEVKEEDSKYADIPAVVQKAFAKKVMQPVDLVWSKSGDFYIAECKVKDQKNELYYTSDGAWEKTYSQIPQQAVTGLMSKHLNQNFKGYRFISAMKETRSDRQDKVLVEFYEKEKL